MPTSAPTPDRGTEPKTPPLAVTPKGTAGAASLRVTDNDADRRRGDFWRHSMRKPMIRLLAVGLILATSIASGVWFWVGVVVAALVMAGMAGASNRPALPWLGAMTLLMWILIHLGAVNDGIGWTILGMSGAGFILLWMQGPGRIRVSLKRRRQPESLRRRAAG